MTSETVHQHWLKRPHWRLALGVSGFFVSLMLSWLVGAVAITASDHGIYGAPGGAFMVILFIAVVGMFGVGAELRKEPNDRIAPFLIGSGVGAGLYFCIVVLLLIFLAAGFD